MEINISMREYISKIFLVKLLILTVILFSVSAFSQDLPPLKVVIKAVGGLQYDVVRFQVNPGQRVELLFQNTDDMEHNLIITLPDSREEVVNQALQLGSKGQALGFIPRTDMIVQSIGILSPREEKKVTFIAPKVSGIYPYVCTLPGHGIIMYGAMYVTDEEMPPLEEDINVPPQRRGASSAGKNVSMEGMSHEKKWHPYELKAPYLYRIFMPESGPASIAVRLPDEVSYCWDAGLCRLRYIWSGDFLDISEPWSIKGDARAKVLGNIFYREDKFPLQLGEKEAQTDYKGYQIVEGGFPEFHYEVNGVEVYELIRPSERGNGIVRNFRIPDGNNPLYFNYTAGQNIQVDSDVGKWNGSRLHLTAKEAKLFSITIIQETN